MTFKELFEKSIYPAKAEEYTSYEAVARQWFEAGQQAERKRCAEIARYKWRKKTANGHEYVCDVAAAIMEGE